MFPNDCILGCNAQLNIKMIVRAMKYKGCGNESSANKCARMRVILSDFQRYKPVLSDIT